MAVLSEHQTSVVVEVDPPLQLTVAEQRLTMDLEWSPFIQASLKCALGDGTIAAIDPTADDVWATVNVRRLLGRVDRIGDLTRRYRGQTLGDITAEFAGETLAGVTLAVYHDYTDPGHPMRSQTRDYRLMLRDQTIDEKAATVEFALASGEARLFDDANAGAEFLIPGATVRAVVQWVLARSGFTIPDAGMGAAVGSSILGDTRLWQPGQTAWDVLQVMTRSINMMLWCDETGQFRLNQDHRRTGSEVTVHSAGADRSVVNAVQKRSRDNGWYTAVQVVFNRGGVETRGFATTPGAPVKIYTRTYPEGYGPPADANALAEAIRKQIVGRGLALELLAVSDYDITPGDDAVFVSPRGTLVGDCTAVEWQWPADEMSVRMREVAA